MILRTRHLKGSMKPFSVEEHARIPKGKVLPKKWWKIPNDWTLWLLIDRIWSNDRIEPTWAPKVGSFLVSGNHRLFHGHLGPVGEISSTFFRDGRKDHHEIYHHLVGLFFVDHFIFNNQTVANLSRPNSALAPFSWSSAVTSSLPEVSFTTPWAGHKNLATLPVWWSTKNPSRTTVPGVLVPGVLFSMKNKLQEARVCFFQCVSFGRVVTGK